MNWLLPCEIEAIKQFCVENRDEFRGCRYLAWLMIDKDVAYASPATVYNIMKRNSLINKWNRIISITIWIEQLKKLLNWREEIHNGLNCLLIFLKLIFPWKKSFNFVIKYNFFYYILNAFFYILNGFFYKKKTFL